MRVKTQGVQTERANPMRLFPSRVLRFGFTALVLAMLVLFGVKVNWRDTWSAMRSASISLLVVATLLNLAAGVLKGVRWWVFLRPIGVTSLTLTLRATFAGAGLNNVLVANGGEAARVLFVARSTRVDSARVAATLALERLFDGVGYVVLLALAALFLEMPPSLDRLRPYALTAPVFVGVLLGWLLRRQRMAEVEASAESASWGSRLKALRSRFVHTIDTVSSRERFIAALLLSVGAWALQVATYQATARAAHFPISTGATVAVLLAVNLGFVVRVTPGNVGLFQAAYSGTAAAFGLGRDEAVAVAFLIQALQIIPVTFLGVCLAPQFILESARRARFADALPVEPSAAGEPSRQP